MNIKITPTPTFLKAIERFQQEKKLLSDDYDAFRKNLAENPEEGDLIPGTGGVRKTRIKSASKGKSGGFRICYYYFLHEEIYLLLIYPKNKKENLTAQETKMLKAVAATLKRTSR